MGAMVGTSMGVQNCKRAASGYLLPVLMGINDESGEGEVGFADPLFVHADLAPGVFFFADKNFVAFGVGA